LLSLAHLSVLDAPPLELIDAAAAGSFDFVGLRLVGPPRTEPWPDITADTDLIRRIQQRQAACGVGILDVETFWLGPETCIDAVLPAFETAARLGARFVLVVGDDAQHSRLVHTFARLCEAAAPFGLKAMLEFIPFSQVRTLEAALRVVQQVQLPNAGVLVDALHVTRSGGAPRDMVDVDPDLLDYWQLCDAPAAAPSDDLRTEARTRRLLPGAGGLPLRELRAVMPAERPIALEVPNAAFAHLPPIERGRVYGRALRAYLESVEDRYGKAS
jgi:sugar phosphate isomerase/epimerase